MNKSVKDKVLEAIEFVRPYLRVDSGDIELVDITDSGIVKVRFLGSCSSCPLSEMTLRAGVELAIKGNVSSVWRVDAVR